MSEEVQDRIDKMIKKSEVILNAGRQTNEEWFCSLSTEEKARFFACEFTVACDDYAYSHNKETWNEKYWLEWLKKEHK